MRQLRDNPSRESGDDSQVSSFDTQASRFDSQASNDDTQASNDDSQASGFDALASGFDALASGFDALASGFDAQASGFDALASGFDAQASGFDALASGGDTASRLQYPRFRSGPSPSRTGKSLGANKKRRMSQMPGTFDSRQPRLQGRRFQRKSSIPANRIAQQLISCQDPIWFFHKKKLHPGPLHLEAPVPPL